ncbi:hypothetical protein BO99DRAFT_37023 [Aspergillus violaceofuscus CBS 115571]|uniref:Uncharacterized protein n=1 Tax=Aspergillus violaceofuscus (strain CBS 115571) TaxID=1450538 RepID=A0A2V5HDJ6_ASPV1|nr:hypothetical protein BO99DRAFT_37023 [Aspergillus violaceofuscus CBS 115571]
MSTVCIGFRARLIHRNGQVYRLQHLSAFHSFSMATGTTTVLTTVLTYLTCTMYSVQNTTFCLDCRRSSSPTASRGVQELSRSSFPRPSLHFHQLSKKPRGPNPRHILFWFAFSLCLFFSIRDLFLFGLFSSLFPLKQSFTPAPSRVMVRLVHRNCQALSPMTRPMRGRLAPPPPPSKLSI